MSRAYERINFRGHTLNRRTVAMIEQMEQVLLGYKVDILQGSYNSGGVSASAGTHDGGGAVDFSWPSGSRRKADAVQVAGRKVGFAIWVRPELWINGRKEWSNHVHGIAIGDRDMSSGASKQVQDYYHGLNALANHASDRSWRPNPIQAFSYPLGTVDLSNVGAVSRMALDKRGTGRPGIKQIQRALNAKSGTHLIADGNYGQKTKQAYARFEKQNGGDGDGLISRHSLELLGLGRFRVVN